jgi:hypothetical protein
MRDPVPAAKRQAERLLPRRIVSVNGFRCCAAPLSSVAVLASAERLK